MAARNAPKPKRIRRTPEEARALILDAALRVFATRLPDQAGLKDVAKEAGVSHALVTHYFGTYDKLVEACLERRFDTLRETLLPALVATADASSMLTSYRQAVAEAAADPATVRLVLWSTLSGRADADDFFPSRHQGLRLLADALEARLGGQREDLEFCIVASFALGVIWQLGGRAMAGGLGKRAARTLEESFQARTGDMIAAYLARP